MACCCQQRERRAGAGQERRFAAAAQVAPTAALAERGSLEPRRALREAREFLHFCAFSALARC